MSKKQNKKQTAGDCIEYDNPAKQYQRTCGGSQKKSKGGALDYPFSSEYNKYPIPNKVDFKVPNGTNEVNDVDLFGCKLEVQKGAGCGCTSTAINLGGGYGYTLDLKHPITNQPEVVRYATDSTMVGAGGNKYLKFVSNKQKGGSAASDSLMEYFLNFQHRCRGSEIY
jgi:hypothetical protein